jgi:GTP-binding protein
MSGQTLDKAAFLLSETDPSRLKPCSAEVTFVGRSNVGKSSLLNALCRKDLARVSSTPGRTRTINVFQVALDRWIVDLPGYGFAGVRGARAAEEVSGWQGMIEGYLTGRASLRMVFLLIDAKVGPTELDREMLRWLKSKALPWHPVATKADQVKRSSSHARRAELAAQLGVEPKALFWVSATEGWGVAELRDGVSTLLA